MEIGALFPQTEIGDNPQDLRDYARAAVEAGMTHLVSYEHVLGATPARLPANYAPYKITDRFHEIFTLYSFLAGVAPQLSFATGILVLPQRQTALVAKQAAQVDLLCGGRFRLGVGLGWNFAEFEGLGATFSNRGRRMEEQIALLRQLWTQDEVNFEGQWDKIKGCGINPLPPQRPIPVWIGGKAEAALRRAAELADGFFPLTPLAGGWSETLRQMRQWREAAGKNWQGFGIEARVTLQPGWQKEVEAWQELGATHVYLSNLGTGLAGREHIQALGALAAEISRLTS